jgi:hypothetical protein
MKTKLTPEQEQELVAAIKEAFVDREWFDEWNIVSRADSGDFPRLTAAVESAVGPKARYSKTGYHRGRLKPSICEKVILTVRKHFYADAAGWWSDKCRAPAQRNGQSVPKIPAPRNLRLVD